MLAGRTQALAKPFTSPLEVLQADPKPSTLKARVKGGVKGLDTADPHTCLDALLPDL